jgi:hypothetical protein
MRKVISWMLVSSLISITIMLYLFIFFFFFLLLISFVSLYCDCDYFFVAFFVEINLKNSSNNSGLEDDYID